MYGIEATDALILVDPQNDFLPGGALAVADGLRIFPPINRIAPHFRHVFATRDWHPDDHDSFVAQGGPWPVHCVAGSPGAQFAQQLDVPRIDAVIDTGVTPDAPGYSGFEHTDLAQRLRACGAKRLFVCGLATDYCVKETVLAAIDAGFQVIVLLDGIAAVDARPGDGAAALEEMRARGAILATTTELDLAGRAA
ncbi:MAG TPA: nicotinamidase [Candidatus Baltobacteraceae bacterium]